MLIFGKTITKKKIFVIINPHVVPNLYGFFSYAKHVCFCPYNENELTLYHTDNLFFLCSTEHKRSLLICPTPKRPVLLKNVNTWKETVHKLFHVESNHDNLLHFKIAVPGRCLKNIFRQHHVFHKPCLKNYFSDFPLKDLKWKLWVTTWVCG